MFRLQQGIVLLCSWATPNGSPITDSQNFEFKNYPILSAKTSLSSPEIQVNGTVDVTLYLSGDGFSLLPTPIDVMLVCDRSGSMTGQDMEDLRGEPEPIGPDGRQKGPH